MNIEEFRNFCLSFPGTVEDLPFDDQTLVFKVMGKMFALCDIDEFRSINLKCEPEKAIELREAYPGIVIPGYHMNKKHWNSIIMNSNIDDDLIKYWIAESYKLVVQNLPVYKQRELHAGCKKKNRNLFHSYCF